MKKIIIDNTEFNFDFGCRLLKLKHESCPFLQLEEIWNDIQPLTFKEIAELPNLEHRRVAINCLGLERLAKEIKPKLIDSKTIKKNSTWINKNGELESVSFNDTYELYEVEGEQLSKGVNRWSRMNNTHFIKCKDTSTDRAYFIWVDLEDVKRTNKSNKPNAIEAIAWTIQTNLVEGSIEKIVRQGDCILLKKNNNVQDATISNLSGGVRHLTKKEYLELLVAES